MDNPKLKNNAQVTLEFALAFIIVVVLMLSGFQIWLNLNQYFVEDSKTHQTWRKEKSSWGANYSTVSGQPPADVSVEVDQAYKDLESIQKCGLVEETSGCAISEETRQYAVSLYSRKIESTQKVEAQREVVSALEDVVDTLGTAYETSPGCIFLRECLESDEWWDDWWCEWIVGQMNPQCNTINEGYRSAYQSLEEQRGVLSAYEAELAEANRQIDALWPQIACCF